MDGVSAYLAELKATRRPILRQHCLQRACNDLPPGALTALYLQLPALGGRALCRLAPAYKYMTAAPRRRAAKRPQLQKQPDFGAHALYTTPDVPRAEKTLFIVFSGQDGQFFMPLSVLLHVLPPGAKDVAVIRSGLEQFFFAGVEGLGRTPYAVAQGLARALATGRYGRVVVLGISAGGLFALRVAGFLGADVAVSFAGIYPDEGFRLREAVNAGATAFDPVCACRPAGPGRWINVVGSKNEFDLGCSMRLGQTAPGVLELHLVNTGMHNVLKPMLQWGYAGWFFRLACARNGAGIRLAAALTRAYGLWVVRGFRRLIGRQRVDDQYLAHRIVAPKR